LERRFSHDCKLILVEQYLCKLFRNA
jgi:hypothetical protein